MDKSKGSLRFWQVVCGFGVLAVIVFQKMVSSSDLVTIGVIAIVALIFAIVRHNVLKFNSSPKKNKYEN